MEFIKRIGEPGKDNPFYYGEKNTMVKYGYFLPNCTTYVHGRFAEMGVDESKLCLGDAKLYYNFKDGFARSSTPKLGAIGCWNGGKYGHIAIVEELYDDGTMLISESDYVQKILFRTRRIRQDENVFGYKLQGFILCPIQYENGSNEGKDENIYKYHVGQKVRFSTCYKSSMDPIGIKYAIQAKDMVRDTGVITKINNGSNNPYLLDNGLCWVNDGDIREVLN